MGRVAIFACFTLMTCVASSESFAQSDAARQACSPDAQRLCSSAGSDPQRVAACLRQNRRSLSPACRSAMARKSRRG
ncbi:MULTISPECIES: cysteine rich repeat-containing protein [unclassified Methylobacterium]|uniref:cysteine rich repeat-containing protein n=1 Tax=unclassified Methylobacterium TaxID=2615210 RepID=UPI0003AA57CE|nr:MULTISPECIES: cysteine rich repeat-containing protein [Methylobacterium]WFT80061.1 cysteine rich repeat-containing protein [Methylobacterium nodulans]